MYVKESCSNRMLYFHLLVFLLFVLDLHEALHESLRLLVELLVLASGHSLDLLLGHGGCGICLNGGGRDGLLGYRLNHVCLFLNLT